MAETIDPLPSYLETLTYLRNKQESYDFNAKKYGHSLENITLLAVAGPTASGKSTLLGEVAKIEPDIHELTSSMTRNQKDRDEPHHNFSVPIETFKDAVDERRIVNFSVLDNNQVYGTFPEDFTAPFTIGAIAIDSIPQLQAAGFRTVRVVYPLMPASDYETRLQSRLGSEDIRGRLIEGDRSLAFAGFNYSDSESWLNFVETDNKEGTLQKVAGTVINLAYQNTAPILTNDRRLELIEDMRGVIARTLKTL